MAKKKPFVVIIGCGRLGSLLANRLSRVGHPVVVVDPDPDAFAGLDADFSGFRVTGDATELRILEEARTGKADLLIATTRDDAVNLMVAQVATRVLGCTKAIARVYDPRRDATFRDLGVETVCPTTLAASQLFETLTLAPVREEA